MSGYPGNTGGTQQNQNHSLMNPQGYPQNNPSQQEVYPPQQGPSYPSSQSSHPPPGFHGYPPQVPPGYIPGAPYYQGSIPYPQAPSGYYPSQGVPGYSPAPNVNTPTPNGAPGYPPPQQHYAPGYPPQQQGSYTQPQQYQGVQSGPNNLQSSSDVQKDVMEIKNAVNGIGTDEKALISVIGNRNPYQIEQISNSYNQSYGKPLWEAVSGDVSGKFRTLLKALIKPLPDFECSQLSLSMILVGKTNAQIQVLKNRFIELYGKTLEKNLKKDIDYDMFRLLTQMLLANRDEFPQSQHDPSLDAEALYKAGPAKLGTDEKTYINIFCSRSYPHLFKVSQAYSQKYGKQLEYHIKKEFSGSTEHALICIIRYACNPSLFFAKEFRRAMDGLGTNDEKLIYLVSRHFHNVYPPYPDLRREIAQAYQNKYSESLKSRIDSETSRDYGRLLNTVMQRNAAFF